MVVQMGVIVRNINVAEQNINVAVQNIDVEQQNINIEPEYNNVKIRKNSLLRELSKKISPEKAIVSLEKSHKDLHCVKMFLMMR